VNRTTVCFVYRRNRGVRDVGGTLRRIVYDDRGRVILFAIGVDHQPDATRVYALDVSERA